MGTIKCPTCSLINWASDNECKRCGSAFREPVPNEQVEALPYAGPDPILERAPVAAVKPGEGLTASRPEFDWSTGSYQTSGNQRFRPAEPKKKVALAVFSMILGLLAMPPVCPIFGLAVGGILGLIFGATGFLVGFLLAFAAIPTGLITGIIALVRSNRRSDQYGGKAFAITGIVCSSIGLAVIPVIAAIAVPNLQASRRAANEGSAIATINKFADAEHAFARDMQVKRYSDLSGLVTAGLIDPDLEKGEKSGYRFRVVANIAGGCEIYAMPMSASYGDRSFYLSIEDGKIRSAVKDGMPANKNDTPIYDDDDDARPTRGVRETSL